MKPGIQNSRNWTLLLAEINEKHCNLSLQRVQDQQGREVWRADASCLGMRWIIYADDPMIALLELERQTRMAMEVTGS